MGKRKTSRGVCVGGTGLKCWRKVHDAFNCNSERGEKKRGREERG